MLDTEGDASKSSVCMVPQCLLACAAAKHRSWPCGSKLLPPLLPRAAWSCSISNRGRGGDSLLLPDDGAAAARQAPPAAQSRHCFAFCIHSHAAAGSSRRCCRGLHDSDGAPMGSSAALPHSPYCCPRSRHAAASCGCHGLPDCAGVAARFSRRSACRRASESRS